jgi:ribosomal protein S27AE
MRALTVLVLFLLAGCPGKSDSNESATTALDACTLAASHTSCPECSNGEITCTYGDVSATRNSCGDCQARSALYAALCDAGVTDNTATIEAGTTCTDPPTM